MPLVAFGLNIYIYIYIYELNAIRNLCMSIFYLEDLKYADIRMSHLSLTSFSLRNRPLE